VRRPSLLSAAHLVPYIVGSWGRPAGRRRARPRISVDRSPGDTRRGGNCFARVSLSPVVVCRCTAALPMRSHRERESSVPGTLEYVGGVWLGADARGPGRVITRRCPGVGVGVGVAFCCASVLCCAGCANNYVRGRHRPRR
jgi:hypothetical protein